MKIINIEEKPFHELPYKSSGKGQPRYCSLPFYFAYVDKLPNNTTSIIATSDLQGREDHENNRLLGEAVSEELTLLNNLQIIPNFELIISVGDLYDKPKLNKYGASGEVGSVINSFANICENVVIVHGNHDIIKNTTDILDNVTILDGNAIKFSNITISGVSGIIGKPERNQRKSEEEYLKLLKKIAPKKADITLLHQSPKGNKPKQIGDINIQEHFINQGQTLLISGHCHWENHLAELGKTQVLNTDSKVFVLLEKK